jgi:hypothetical protein
MFRLVIIALALVASASANDCDDANYPALVSTDCTAAAGMDTRMTVTTVTDLGGDKYTTSVALCMLPAACSTGTDADTVTTCVADSTACMVGSSCSGPSTGPKKGQWFGEVHPIATGLGALAAGVLLCTPTASPRNGLAARFRLGFTEKR